ncbi:hypothetical protein [Terriglobus tenax]|uniref:hypothetical protein n=1 Tax=Terriglobus tenax TaxID=1111115 RepID=UPI0021E0BFB5|nr:hypothetical protein [Terriglobus tenax]
MNRQTVTRAAFAIAFTAITMAPTAQAASFFKKSTPDTQSAMKKAGKTVKFTVRNDSNEARELRIGDEVVTVAAKTSKQLEAAEGASVYNNTATEKLAAGTLMVQVTKQLNNATLALN